MLYVPNLHSQLNKHTNIRDEVNFDRKLYLSKDKFAWNFQVGSVLKVCTAQSWNKFEMKISNTMSFIPFMTS